MLQIKKHTKFQLKVLRDEIISFGVFFIDSLNYPNSFTAILNVFTRIQRETSFLHIFWCNISKLLQIKNTKFQLNILLDEIISFGVFVIFILFDSLNYPNSFTAILNVFMRIQRDKLLVSISFGVIHQSC